MKRNYVGAATLALLGLAVVGGVLLARQTDPAVREPATTVNAPGVQVETGDQRGGTAVRAPYTNVETDRDGVRVQAPGVDITFPKSKVE
jgi:NAD/NADP transhydrogenase alpha subunit